MALVNPVAVSTTVEAGLRRQRRGIGGPVFEGAAIVCVLLTLAVLAAMLVTVFAQGSGVLAARGLDFLTTGTAGSPARAGVWQAVLGSMWIGAIVTVLAFPLGIGAAVYLEEYAAPTRLNGLIDVNVRNLAGVPSIVYGLLGFAVFVKIAGGLTGGRSVIAAGLTLSVLVLPIVIITSAEALRAVPSSIREGALALGATRWEVTRRQVVPAAAPGILTGTVLALARALGEAAPLILVGAMTGFFALPANAGVADSLQGPFTALPVSIYDWARKPGDGWPELTAAAIVVMLVVVLAANATAIILRNRFERKRG